MYSFLHILHLNCLIWLIKLSSKILLNCHPIETSIAILEPSVIGEPTNPFATPLEILPEWYFFPLYQILCTVPNKLLGVLLMVSVPSDLLTGPILEIFMNFKTHFAIH